MARKTQNRLCIDHIHSSMAFNIGKAPHARSLSEAGHHVFFEARPAAHSSLSRVLLATIIRQAGSPYHPWPSSVIHARWAMAMLPVLRDGSTRKPNRHRGDRRHWMTALTPERAAL
jgi:hypothetical protein